MSGQATGWVLRHGPRPDDLDLQDRPYGTARARARRLVLAVIADAANADGRHSHPGGPAIEAGALFSRSHAKGTVRELVMEGWLAIEEPGGGRGRATVYAIPGVADPSWTYRGRVTVQGSDPSGGGNGPISEAETVRSETVNGPPSDLNGPVQGCPQRFTNGDTNGNDQLPGLSAGGPLVVEPAAVSRRKVAEAVTNAAWEATTPRPSTPWIAARKLVEAFLAAGWEPSAVEAALLAAPTWTKGAIEFALRRARPTATSGPRAPIPERRDAPEGRVIP